MTEERLDRIEHLLANSVERQSEFEERQARYETQREHDRKDWEERDRQLTEKLNKVSQQQAAFQDGLKETKALQQRNAEAISQLTSSIEQLRQAIANGAVNSSDLKTELARHANDSNAHSE